jgi:CBS domain-containing protein
MAPTTTIYRCPFCPVRVRHANELTRHLSTTHPPAPAGAAGTRGSGDRHPPRRRPLKIREVMSTPAIVVGPRTTLAGITHCLLANRVGGVPVVDHNGLLLGIVTEADLIAKQAYDQERRRTLALVNDYLHGRDPSWARPSAELTARDLMTPAPASVHPDDDLSLAIDRILVGDHKRLPVIDRGRVVGVVSRHDLLRVLGQPAPADVRAAS